MPGTNLLTISQTESCGLRHYSSADAKRIGSQHHHLIKSRRTNGSGSGFQAAAALRSHILYKTTSNEASKKVDLSTTLSASLSNRPEWSSTSKHSTSNSFTTSFNNIMHENSSIGSIGERENRRVADELKKIKQHEERAKLYQELITRQEQELFQKKERKRKRREKYELAVSSAIKIQNSIIGRIWLAKQICNRIRLAIKNNAAIRMQMHSKRYIIRERCKQRKQLGIETKASLKIQFEWGQRQQRVEAKEDLKNRRNNRARARRRLLRDMNKERRKVAAVMIQGMVRGWKGRKIIKLLEMERRRARKKRNVQQQGAKAKTKSKQKNKKEKRKKKGVKGPES